MVTLLSFCQCERVGELIYQTANSHLGFNAEKVSQFPQCSTHPTRPGRGSEPDSKDHTFIKALFNMAIKQLWHKLGL